MMYDTAKITIKESKKILLNHHPEIVKLLEENFLKFDIVEHLSFKEEY